VKRSLLAIGAVSVLLFGIGGPAAFAAPSSDYSGSSKAGPAGWPSDCRDEVMTQYQTGAYCLHTNGGFYQAIAVCKFKDTGKTGLFYGTWEGRGAPSYAYCQGYSYVDSSGINTTPTPP
jgi:hypothetical protein